MIATSEGSVTRLVFDLKAGDREAMDELWSRYFGRLVRLARGRLGSFRGRGASEDEEDAALSALNSLWDRASGGGLPDLKGRDELWRLLVVITARKANRQVERQFCQKRGGGRVVGEGALAPTPAGPGPGGEGDVFAQVIGREPTPEFAAMVAEETRRLLDGLGDETLRRIAVSRMEGYSSPEIAGSLGCTARTVDRKLDLIRHIWRDRNPG